MEYQVQPQSLLMLLSQGDGLHTVTGVIDLFYIDIRRISGIRLMNCVELALFFVLEFANKCMDTPTALGIMLDEEFNLTRSSHRVRIVLKLTAL